VEMHTHNDFGLANANSLAGIKAGAKFISTTVGGLGERAGNTALEEIVMSCRHLLKMETGVDTRKLKSLAEFVAHASGRPIHISKPMLGSNCFAHEAGIHADGVLKNSQNYEPYDPEEMGLERKIIIGKHSGSKTLITDLGNRGIEVSKDDAETLLAMTRRAAVELHRSLTSDELLYLYTELKRSSDPFDEKAREIDRC